MKNKLIIITGEPGSGKTTFANENYPNAVYFDHENNDTIKKVQKSHKENELTVICCFPKYANLFIPKENDTYWKMITLNIYEIIQVCGRGKF